MRSCVTDPLEAAVVLNASARPAGFESSFAPTVWVPSRYAAPTGAAIPVPVSGTPCGLPAALSVICSELLRAPSACGLNAMLTVQVPPGATEAARQVLDVTVKSRPATDTVLIVSGPFPVLLTVTARGADAVLTI